MEVEKKSKVWEYIGWGSFILVGSFLFFCALILVFGDPKTKYQAQEVTALGHEVKDAEKDSKKEYSIGETIKLGDHRLTVTEVKKSPGGEFDKPRQGHEYILVAVNIYNGGKEDISYNTLDFEMRNSQGNITRPTLSMINQNTALNSGQLAPKGQVAGTIVFEQPIGEKLKLQFTPNFWSKKKIIINL
ncbi:DUF4352 domain-containing protein (plasmid) [Bacillus tropicus]|uniref:DUF4352 domain-containing protein n=1 Tax=Bacillus cereus group TaxID=86661 RepID=UPI0013E075B6|nr:MULTISPECIES: DUF4352 domain-containing protein [Bacillus cereus group]MCB4848582.1 DUF4352 domain-containing protein [Bacillus tropicus]MDA1581923.1 DUF4352 domain-containing protein [Bacillus cereus group sp. TH228LC]MDA1641785.1 DUF4352 domain-containing protein [Bacillus cereus group sp. TH177-1LC]MDA1860944.1 DUF4352 domain-containing protein [Bacillus cereus group sp. BY122LC]QIE40481.1 DUF4352 domain-containing protein [Bacillus tropicus]